MSDTTTETSDVTYQVGAGPYAFRVDGLRLSEKEASDYLVVRKNYRRCDAFAAVNLAQADAVNSAELPTIRRSRHLHGEMYEYEVDGLTTDMYSLRNLLVSEYRRTPAEVEQILVEAIGH